MSVRAKSPTVMLMAEITKNLPDSFIRDPQFMAELYINSRRYIQRHPEYNCTEKLSSALAKPAENHEHSIVAAEVIIKPTQPAPAKELSKMADQAMPLTTSVPVPIKSMPLSVNMKSKFKGKSFVSFQPNQHLPVRPIRKISSPFSFRLRRRKLKRGTSGRYANERLIKCKQKSSSHSAHLFPEFPPADVNLEEHAPPDISPRKSSIVSEAFLVLAASQIPVPA